ncbi:hypothetical protein LX36DRAFT_674554, partial [Colletotrichum falcatum]
IEQKPEVQGDEGQPVGKIIARETKAAKKGARASKISGITNSKQDGHAAKDFGAVMTRDDLARDDANWEISPWKSFDPEAPLPQFSFADTTKIMQEELEERIHSLDHQGIHPTFIHALRRGLAVHHAGMNRNYRQLVEMLFRKGYLSAVIATGTLALGLNMPCKTVVFAGDSVFLTSLNYRQASGRAGRRGFDLLGNVVFHDIPKQRAMEFISSRLPDLRGRFPISVTLILRLFGLLHGTKDSEYAVKAVESLLMQTRVFLGGPASQMTVKHHGRFSIEYLRRQHLLSANGVPLNFSGLHLRHTSDDKLPFTKRRVGPTESESIDAAAMNISLLPPTFVRSHFSALSGFTDNFLTIHELCETVRAGVFLDESAIPYIPIYPYETNNVPWNAYIYDFFKHGDLEALVRDNGIKRGDVWFRLKDFSLILATIVTSLEIFLGSEDIGDADMVDVQDVGDILEEERFDTDFVQQSSGVSRPAPAALGLRSKASLKKQKVVNSWEDESDSDKAVEDTPD